MLPFPIIDNDELAKLIHINDDGDLPGFAARRRQRPVPGGRRRRWRCAGPSTASAARSAEAIADGARIIVLSDRDADEVLAPIPSLLLTSAVHHHLIREKTRTKVGLVVEAGDAREVHHMALLIGYGAGAINPYLAFETIEDMIAEGLHGMGGLDPSRPSATTSRRPARAC